MELRIIPGEHFLGLETKTAESISPAHPLSAEVPIDPPEGWVLHFEFLTITPELSFNVRTAYYTSQRRRYWITITSNCDKEIPIGKILGLIFYVPVTTPPGGING